jgi:hypothetical protein
VCACSVYGAGLQPYRAFEHVGDLLLVVGVASEVGAGGALDLRDHRPLAAEDPAGERRAEGLGGEVVEASDPSNPDRRLAAQRVIGSACEAASIAKVLEVIIALSSDAR